MVKQAVFSHLFNVLVHTPYSDAICCRDLAGIQSGIFVCMKCEIDLTVFVFCIQLKINNKPVMINILFEVIFISLYL